MNDGMDFLASTIYRPTENEALKHLARYFRRRDSPGIVIRAIIPPPFTLVPLREKDRFWKDVFQIRTILAKNKNAYWRKTRRGWREYREPQAIVAAMILDGHFWVHVRHVEEALSGGCRPCPC